MAHFIDNNMKIVMCLETILIIQKVNSKFFAVEGCVTVARVTVDRSEFKSVVALRLRVIEERVLVVRIQTREQPRGSPEDRKGRSRRSSIDWPI